MSIAKFKINCLLFLCWIPDVFYLEVRYLMSHSVFIFPPMMMLSQQLSLFTLGLATGQCFQQISYLAIISLCKVGRRFVVLFCSSVYAFSHQQAIIVCE